MKTITKLLLSSVLLLNSATLFAQAAVPASLENKGSRICIENYCDFLNTSAAEDVYGFYDEYQAIGCRLQAVGAEITDTGIIRSGPPGSYRYDVMDGKEGTAITYVSAHDMAYTTATGSIKGINREL